MKTLKIVALSLALFTVGACKKKDDKAADKPAETAPAGSAAGSDMAKPGDTAKPADTAAKPAEGAPAGGAAAGDSEMETKGVALMTKMGDIFAADAGDCEKLATDLKAFIGENKAQMTELAEMDKKQTPEQKKAFDERHKGDMDAMQKKMTPAITKCKDNANVKAAMKDMPM